MQLTQSASLRMEQRQLLTPRMIQSMEILQMPLVALEERIEQELESNPVLEVRTGSDEPGEASSGEADGYNGKVDNGTLNVEADSGTAEDFARLERISEYLENEEYSPFNDPKHGPRMSSYAGERDGKLDAMANTADRAGNLTDHLLDQWRMVEISAPAALNGEGPRYVAEVRRAGETIIGFIDDRGYLPLPIDAVREEAGSRKPNQPSPVCFRHAWALVRTLDPAGVGARDLPDCLLLQLETLRRDPELAEGHDFELECTLVRHHLEDLGQNRYPHVAKKTGREIDEIKAAVRRLSRLSPHPGRQLAPDDAPPIMPDATIRYDEDAGEYTVVMTRDPAPDLHIRAAYRKMLKARTADKDTRAFLSNNMRNARWLIESIEQRRGTIERVIRAVVKHQREFFEHGPEQLRPLPMIQVADELGIHVATVSRAVSEKWLDTPRGLYPLRRFFSGGTISDGGEEMSWDAVKEKLRRVVEDEDKGEPLNDDQIVEKLADQGIELARRTVAKYRKILSIPTARQRRQY